MPFAVTDTPDYILDQVLGYASINVLFDNDVAMKGSIDIEHVFSSGVHRGPRVATIEGFVAENSGYSLTRGTNIPSVDVSGLSTGQCRVNFSETFASQDFATFVSSNKAGHIAGWQFDGSSKSSIIVDTEDNDGTPTDAGFSISVHGVIV